MPVFSISVSLYSVSIDSTPDSACIRHHAIQPYTSLQTTPQSDNITLDHAESWIILANWTNGIAVQSMEMRFKRGRKAKMKSLPAMKLVLSSGITLA